MKMNLHEIAPQYFVPGETVDPELEKIYKWQGRGRCLLLMERLRNFR